MGQLDGQVALVTGASRGVGRGAALGLAHAGAKVFATGRSIARAELDSAITALVCDHTDGEAVDGVFRQIADATARLDILVNAVWGGYE
jgi:dehydrogenase/reductase SDR family member 1